MARGALARLWDWQSRHRSARGAASERTVPTHSGASPRPDVRASGLTCPTRPTRLSSQRQQVAPDSPPSPQPRWATSPGALASGMEADGDLEELARLRSVFAACDANRSGRLEREEFRALCAELRVRPADAEAVFQRLDADRDGAITFQEFARGFRGARRGGPRRGWGPREPAPAAAQVGSDPGSGEEDEGDEDAAAALAAPWDPASSGQAWQDFQARLGDEVKFIPRYECGLEGGRWWCCFLSFPGPCRLSPLPSECADPVDPVSPLSPFIDSL